MFVFISMFAWIILKRDAFCGNDFESVGMSGCSNKQLNKNDPSMLSGVCEQAEETIIHLLLYAFWPLLLAVYICLYIVTI